MQTRNVWFWLLPLLAAIGFPLGASADEVFKAKVSLGAVAEGDDGIDKVKVSSNALLNVARNRRPDASVPPGEVLALVVDCANEGARLSVVDLLGGPQELATIAISGDVDVVEGASSGAVVADLEVEEGR